MTVMAMVLPVLMPAVDDQRWSCHSCGDCCRTLVGHLTDAERLRLDEQGWAGELGTAAYVAIPRGWALNKRADGACVFLSEDNRCRIHAKFGEEAKPLACRIFPFSVRRSADGWQASLRFDCPSVTSSEGAPLDRYRGSLNTLVGELPAGDPVAEVVSLQRGRTATTQETDAVLGRFSRWLTRDDLPMTGRLIGASRLTATLCNARLKNVRDDRLIELLDLLGGTLTQESSSPVDSPTLKQRAMLRQLAFAHAEHVSLAESRGGWRGRLGKRWQQLGSARAFLRGDGRVPRLPGFEGAASFADVEAVTGVRSSTAEVEDLLRRYVVARLAGRSVFGGGFYGWPVFAGLAAFLLSIAAAGWLARYRAAAQERRDMDFADAAAALGVVDRAATRLPALGTLAERTRIAYLLNDDGIARLLRCYAFEGSSV